MAERLRCKKCKKIWTYRGYPAYIGCPNCGCLNHDDVVHEEVCPKCNGTGRIRTNEVTARRRRALLARRPK